MRDTSLDRRMAEMAAHGDDDRASVTAARWWTPLRIFHAGLGILAALAILIFTAIVWSL